MGKLLLQACGAPDRKDHEKGVVGGSGLEPLTSCVSSKYSNQLS